MADNFEIDGTETPAEKALNVGEKKAGLLDQASEHKRLESNYNIKMGVQQPDQDSTEINKLSEEMNLPSSYVSRNLDLIRSKSKEQQVKGLRDTNKNVRKWMDTPEKASLVSKDIEKLREMSDSSQELVAERDRQSTARKFYNQLGSGTASVNSMILKIPALAHQAVAHPFNVVARELDIPSLRMPIPEFLIDNPVLNYYDKAAQDLTVDEAKESIVGQIKEGKYADAAFNTLLSSTQQVPLLTGMVVSAMFGIPTPAILGGMGALTAADVTVESQREGLDPATGLERGLLHGTAEMLGEMVTLGLINKSLINVGKNMAKTMGKQAAKETIVKNLKKVGMVGLAAGQEGVSESATTIMQDISSYLTGDLEALNGTGQRAMESFLIALPTGGGLQTIGQIRQDMYQAGQYKNELKLLEESEELVSDMGIKNEGGAEDLVDNMLEGEKIYISPKLVRDFYTQADKVDDKAVEKEAKDETKEEEDFNKFVEDMGLEDQLAEAEATGGEFEISKARWLLKYSKSPLADALREDIRFSAEGLTGKDVKALKESATEKVAQLQQEIEAINEIDAIDPDKLEPMRSALMQSKRDGGMGMKAEAADNQLKLFMAAGKFATRYTGETLDQWFDRINPQLEIGGEFKGEEGAFFQRQGNIVGKTSQGISLAEGETSQVEVEAREEIPVVKLSKFRNSQRFIENPATLKTELDKVYGNQAVKNEHTGRNIKITTQALSDVVDNMLQVYDQIKIKSSKKAPVYFKEAANALKSLPRMIESATLIAKKGKNDIYFVKGGQTLMKFEVQNGAIVDAEIVLEKPSTQAVSTQKGRKVQAAEGNISIADFARSVNDARGTFTFFQEDTQQDKLGFFSQLQSEVNKMDFKQMPAKDLANRIKKLQGVKKEELEQTGIIELLEATEGKVTKEDVGKLLDEGGLQLEEVTLDDAAIEPVPLEWDENEDGELEDNEVGYKIFPLDAGPDTGKYLLHDPFDTEIGIYYSVEEAKRDAEMHLGEDNMDATGEGLKTKFGQWQLPGGENYREVLLRLPRKVNPEVLARRKELNNELRTLRQGLEDGTTEDVEGARNAIAAVNEEKARHTSTSNIYNSPHWDESNVLAHFRLNDRVDSEGKKTLFIEEIQSDWHQEGRRKGYDTPSGVPNAPFKNTEAWTLLAFKRVLRMAAEGGYDAVAWTPGEVQNERYDLSKQVDSITYIKDQKDTTNIIIRKDGKVLEQRDVANTELDAFVGKDIANKILEGKETDTLEGVDLKVGGEGMKAFYDKMLPKAVGKYIKKLDKSAKVGIDKIQIEEEAFLTGEKTKGEQEVWTVPITDKIKEDVLEGQTLFQAEDKKVRAAIRFQQNETIINLFNGANMSSLLHESGHIFVKEMQEIIESGKGDEQLLKDYETLRTLADGEFNTEGIEKVVRGFESYLKEGKAPSVELQSAFAQFKEWLMVIYQNIKGQLPKINNEVRDVFDRMLATDAEIKEVQAAYEQKETIAELLDAPKKKKVEVQEKKDIAVETAQEKLLAKYLKAYTRAQGGKKGIEKKVEAEVAELPIYKAVDIAVNKGGIDPEELNERAGKEETKDIKKKFKGSVTKDSKMSIGELAIESEYESEDALIRDLKEQPSQKEKVDLAVEAELQRVEDELKEEISKGETIPGEVEYHSDEKLSFLEAEYEILRDKLGKDEKARNRKGERRAYKEAAKESLLNKPTKSATRYDLFAKTEQRYANSSYQKAKDGKYEQALEDKNKQILNHIMVQEAVKLRDQKFKIERSYKSKAIKPKINRAENSYAQIASKLINQYGLNKTVQPTDDVSTLLEVDETLSEQTPEWIEGGLAPSGETNYKEMKFSEFLSVDESVKSILHSGRSTMLSMDAQGFKTVGEVVESSIALMEGLKDKKKLDESKLGTQFRQSVNNKLEELLIVEYAMEELDNFNMHRNGEFGTMRQMWSRGREAEGEFKDIQNNVMTVMAPFMDKLTEAKDRIEKERGTGFFKIEGAPVPLILQESGKQYWTAERAISFILNTGNEHNLEVIKNAYEYTDEQINAISSMFTSEELNAFQGIWDSIDTLYQPLTDTNFRMYNRNLPKVAAQPVTLIDREGQPVVLKGGYYPLQFDRGLSDVAALRQEAEITTDRNNAVLRSSKPTDGMTKIRGTTHSLPPLLAVSVLNKHIVDTARFISHSEYLRDMDRVTRNPDWVAKAKEKVGRGVYAMLRENLKFQAKPERRFESKWDALFNKQRGMATSIILGLNVSVGLKQRLSGLSAQTDLGGTWILKSLKDADLSGSVLGKSTSKMWQEVRTKSKYIRAREGSIDREIHDMVSNMSPFLGKINIPGFGKGVTMQDVRDAMFFMIQANDRAMTGVVWKAAYMKSMDGNKNSLDFDEAEKKAVAFADSVVAQTQPSALPLDLSKIQRSEGATRLFTSFMTWTLKQGNRFVHKKKAMEAGAITRKEYIKHLIQEGVMAPWGATIISAVLATGELPEWDEFIWGPVEYSVSGIPLARDISGSIRYRKSVGSIPAFEGANRLVNTGVTAAKFLEGDAEFYDLLWSMGRTAEAWTGVPALKAVKNMKNTYEIVTGQK